MADQSLSKKACVSRYRVLFCDTKENHGLHTVMKCFGLFLFATAWATAAPTDDHSWKNDDNFLHNCEFVNFGLGDNDQNPWIHYSCPLDQPPYLQCSRLELNDCIINAHGVLRGQEKGGFAKSCKDCVYHPKIGNLVCQCRGAFADPNQYRETHRYLDQDVWLSGSKLGCFGMKSSSKC
ncbi:hypothetical protein CORC01_11269 [Colletotrichum orchidophilum]|uniref:Cyanovirin-N domain-containing protein n=1 Tax=Colletotrichum orchidophilum TaxID=1209926 RepID=A0A1G4AW89_9PEZI|nr:uncharacterized protein CORC01_11269 [Colletotrichum orchidophilum]OHE93404.1 hypothetical protein CORC01_11269 [Colletotrichum orchidophilum]